MYGGGARVEPWESTRCDPDSRREPFDDPEMKLPFGRDMGHGPVHGELNGTEGPESGG